MKIEIFIPNPKHKWVAWVLWKMAHFLVWLVRAEDAVLGYGDNIDNDDNLLARGSKIVYDLINKESRLCPSCWRWLEGHSKVCVPNEWLKEVADEI